MSGRQPSHSEASRPTNPMSITAMLNDSEGDGRHERVPRGVRLNPQTAWSGQAHWQDRRSDQNFMDERRCSDTDADADAGREKRDSYNEEQKNFIYYHRLVLGQSWERIEKDFWNHFGQRRSKSGLQCRFYRVLSERGSGKVRDQGRPDKQYKLDEDITTGVSNNITSYRG